MYQILRVTQVNARHVHCDLFMKNACNGHLCFDHEEYNKFMTVLKQGSWDTFTIEEKLYRDFMSNKGEQS